MWESLQWADPTDREENELRGISTNADQATYDLTAQKTNAGIVVSATKRNRNHHRHHGLTPSFVATFRQTAKEPLRLFGTWTSLKADFPHVYAGILSGTRLICEISCFCRNRSNINRFSLRTQGFDLTNNRAANDRERFCTGGLQSAPDVVAVSIFRMDMVDACG